jgi:hypothetical protein
MKIETWHRRQAIFLASQLPDSTESALIILRLVQELVTGFLLQPEGEEPKRSSVVALVRD